MPFYPDMDNPPSAIPRGWLKSWDVHYDEPAAEPRSQCHSWLKYGDLRQSGIETGD